MRRDPAWGRAEACPHRGAGVEVTRLVRTLAALAVGVAACVAVSWPAALTWRTHTVVPAGYADVQAGWWWPRQVGDALLAGRDPFQAPDLFWPAGQDVTLLVWNVLAELVLWPLWQALPPYAALNLAAFVAAGLNAAAAAAAARRLGAPRVGEAAAALLAGGSHFAFIEMVNGRIEQAMWAPVVLFLAELVAPEKRPLRAGLWLGLSAAVYWFYGYFLLLVIAGWLATRRDADSLRFALRAGVVSAVTALPALAPVVAAAAAGAPRRAGDDTLVAQAAASLPFPHGLCWPLGVEPAFAAMAVPLVVLPLAAWALWPRDVGATSRPIRELGAVVLITVLLALGPRLVGPHGVPWADGLVWLPHAALDLLPGMGRFWWCYRWLTIALPAAVLVAAVGLGSRPGWLLAFTLVWGAESAALLRGGDPGRALPRQAVRTPPVVDLAPPGESAPVLVLPKGDVRAIHLGWQAWFRQPTDLGLGSHLPGVVPGEYTERLRQSGLGRVIAGEPAPEAWTEADTAGFRWVLLFYRDAGPGRRDHDAETTALEKRLTTAFGPPHAKNELAAWWTLPGSVAARAGRP